MALKDTVLGWLRHTPEKREELEEAEADTATSEYAEQKLDDVADQHLGTRPGQFEHDQDAPRS